MFNLRVAVAETPTAALIVTEERRVLVLPVGPLSVETLDRANVLLALAELE